MRKARLALTRYSMEMDWSRIREAMAPGGAEDDPRFRQETLRLSHLGLRITGWIELIAPVIMFVALALTRAGEAPLSARIWQALTLMAVGAMTLAAAKQSWSRPRARFLAAFSGWLVTAALICTSVLLTPEFTADDHYIPGEITTVLLALVATTPLRPLQMLSLGLSISFFYLAACVGAEHAHILPDWDPYYFVFALMLTMLTTALTAVLYGQRAASHRDHLNSLRITEALAAAQGRALLSENAMAVGRLAAALTHELNTPLGALKSCIDTMLVVAGRQAAAKPEEQQRLVKMQAELRRSVAESIARLQKVMARLKRFIQLEENEMTSADLNELINDVMILFETQVKDKIKLEFNSQPVPEVTCNRQQMTTVISSLLSNAINAINGDGHIMISTRRLEAAVEVQIQDNGRGMDSEELENIFDPSFRVTAGRVSSGNWSLFSSRQVIFEHGGDITIDSALGKGTTVCVTLPCAG